MLRARNEAATSRPMKLAPRTTARRAVFARSMIARQSLSDRSTSTSDGLAPGMDGLHGLGASREKQAIEGNFSPLASATSRASTSIAATVVLRRRSMALSE